MGPTPTALRAVGMGFTMVGFCLFNAMRASALFYDSDSARERVLTLRLLARSAHTPLRTLCTIVQVGEAEFAAHQPFTM